MPKACWSATERICRQGRVTTTPTVKRRYSAVADSCEMNSEKRICAKCGASILVSTAKANQGRCAPCWKRRASVRAKECIHGNLRVVGFIIALPFIGIWTGLGYLYRYAIFPYSRAGLLSQILEIYPDLQVARLYRVGVIDGYFEREKIMMTVYPGSLTYCRGWEDGSGLRRGKIEISAIPNISRRLARIYLRRRTLHRCLGRPKTRLGS